MEVYAHRFWLWSILGARSDPMSVSGHNLKVIGSNPTPQPIKPCQLNKLAGFYFCRLVLKFRHGNHLATA
jgi:hypothetical protein